MNSYNKQKLNKRIEKIIQKTYEITFNDLKETFTSDLNNKKRVKLVKKYQNQETQKEFTKQVSKQLTQAMTSLNKKEWKKEYDKAKKKKIGLEPFWKLEKEITKKLYQRNLRFITSIPQDILKVNKYKYVKKIKKQVLQGDLGRSELEKFLKNLRAKRSKLIARTETARAQTAVIETRTRELGGNYYIWLSANDQRTRLSHRKMKNVIVEWSDDENEKPFLDNMYGNAGEFPNCRCSPEPIFSEKNLPNSNTLSYYDSSKQKVIKKSRKEIIKMIFDQND